MTAINQAYLDKKCRPIEYKGVVYKSIAAAARHFGIDESTLRARLNYYHYTIPQAIELPTYSHCKLKRIRPVVKKLDEAELLKQFSDIWGKNQLKPNMNSRRGLYG